MAAAQKLLMLQAILLPEEQLEAEPVALFLYLLQPTISSMLGLPPEDFPADPGPPGEAAARWRFLLGNTLLRLLEQLPLPENRALQWWRRAAGIQRADGIEEAAAMAPEAAAACKLAALLLSELGMGQAPHLTCAMLQRWAGRADGSPERALAGVEFPHARAIGLELCNGTSQA